VSRFILLFLSLLYFANAAIAADRLEPETGCYLGTHLDEVNDSVVQYEARMGYTPAAFGHFARLPLTAQERANLDAFIGQVKPGRGIAFVTLEPMDGLDAVTQAACDEIAALCAGYEAQGIGGIIIRFAHEMNGNWFPWGQRPILYKEKFRLFASRVHAATSRTAVMWAPNYGGQYPFGNGVNPAPQPGSADFIALDTDGNGTLSMSDDPYSPYYPGDDVVDWVGLTLTHWGNRFPWGENEIPEPRRFADSLQGNYNGQLGDERAVPDFYALFCGDAGHRKPLAMAETAAFFNTSRSDGASEFDIKQGWWTQVFNISGDTPNGPDVANHFPKLKLVMWFDWRKVEGEAQNNVVDWSVSRDPNREAFRTYVQTLKNGQRYFLTAADVRAMRFNVDTSLLPKAVRLTGAIHVILDVKAEAACDVVIDLLDGSNAFFGGTRVTIGPGAQRVERDVIIKTPLTDGKTYRWNAFLAPQGANFDQAYNWGAPVETRAMLNIPEMKLTSGPTANPNPAPVGRAVQLSAAATGLAPLQWTWNFGDGTGAAGMSNAEHTFTTAGTYNVTVTVVDAIGQAASGTVKLGVGTGKPFTVSKAQIKLNLAKSGKDSVSISGMLPEIPAGFTPGGLPVTVQVDGVSQSFVLDAKGRAKSGAAAFGLKMKMTRDKATKISSFAGGSAPFTFTLKNADLSALRAALQGGGGGLPIQVQVGDLGYAGTLFGTYTEKAGKSGLFKN